MFHGRFTGNYYVKKVEKSYLFVQISATFGRNVPKCAETGKWAFLGRVALSKNYPWYPLSQIKAQNSTTRNYPAQRCKNRKMGHGPAIASPHIPTWHKYRQPNYFKQSVYRMKLKVKEANNRATHEPAIYLSCRDGQNKMLPEGKLVRLREPAGQTGPNPGQLPPPSAGPLTPAILKTFAGCGNLGEKEAADTIEMLSRFSTILYQAVAS
jgi:hypothetical protein